MLGNLRAGGACVQCPKKQPSVQALFRIHRYMYARHVFDAESVGGGARVGGDVVVVAISPHSHFGSKSSLKAATRSDIPSFFKFT